MSNIWSFGYSTSRYYVRGKRKVRSASDYLKTFELENITYESNSGCATAELNEPATTDCNAQVQRTWNSTQRNYNTDLNSEYQKQKKLDYIRKDTKCSIYFYMLPMALYIGLMDGYDRA